MTEKMMSSKEEEHMNCNKEREKHAHTLILFLISLLQNMPLRYQILFFACTICFSTPMPWTFLFQFFSVPTRCILKKVGVVCILEVHVWNMDWGRRHSQCIICLPGNGFVLPPYSIPNHSRSYLEKPFHTVYS